jgi:hypothetical protein
MECCQNDRILTGTRNIVKGFAFPGRPGWGQEDVEFFH